MGGGGTLSRPFATDIESHASGLCEPKLDKGQENRTLAVAALGPLEARFSSASAD